jgi:hypothetical protein
MNRFLDWLDDRSGIRVLVKEALYEKVPGGARWRYVWGSCLTFAFFYSGGNGHASLDVLQPKCSNCMGERLLYPISGMGWVVSPRRSPLHGTGYDCASCFTPYAGND